MPSSGVEVGDRVPDDDSDVDHGVLEFIKPAPWTVSGPCTPSPYPPTPVPAFKYAHGVCTGVQGAAAWVIPCTSAARCSSCVVILPRVDALALSGEHVKHDQFVALMFTLLLLLVTIGLLSWRRNVVRAPGCATRAMRCGVSLSWGRCVCGDARAIAYCCNPACAGGHASDGRAARRGKDDPW